HVLKEMAERWRPEFDSMQVGMPLLANQEDHEKIAEILWEALSSQIADKTLIFMGHGTHHGANAVYRQLEETFHRMGHEEVYIATMEAEPTLEDVMARMAKKQRRGVVLTPLMLVAGDHAVHDMMGAEDSYFIKLIQRGYQVNVICKGLGEYADIRNIYVSNLKKSMEIL
ncbi:MAG: sirohydrochlorin cobaltochelatase, partial [Hungatella sp.]